MLFNLFSHELINISLKNNVYSESHGPDQDKWIHTNQENTSIRTNGYIIKIVRWRKKCSVIMGVF